MQLWLLHSQHRPRSSCTSSGMPAEQTFSSFHALPLVCYSGGVDTAAWIVQLLHGYKFEQLINQCDLEKFYCTQLGAVAEQTARAVTNVLHQYLQGSHSVWCSTRISDVSFVDTVTRKHVSSNWLLNSWDSPCSKWFSIQRIAFFAYRYQALFVVFTSCPRYALPQT